MKKQTVHIIGSLIEMTGHRDRDLIGVSLVKTLFQLLSSTRVELYEVQKEDEAVVLKHLAHIDEKGVSSRLDTTSDDFKNKPSESILQCINTGTEVTIDLERDEKQCIVPIFDEKEMVVGLLIHTGANCLPESQQLTKGVLQLYQNFRSLVESSQRDPMTGLLNRETFVESLSKIMLDSQLKAGVLKNANTTRREYNEEEFSYWIGLFDIDHFKKINDNYGHLFGDEVILLVVQQMNETFRKEDLLFRYGGEEFIAVISVPSKEDAERAFERLRIAVETKMFGIAGQVTISIGYVQIGNKELPLSVVGKADKALYYAKENGRNCAYDYTVLLEKGEFVEEPIDLDDESGFESF